MEDARASELAGAFGQLYLAFEDENWAAWSFADLDEWYPASTDAIADDEDIAGEVTRILDAKDAQAAFELCWRIMRSLADRWTPASTSARWLGPEGTGILAQTSDGAVMFNRCTLGTGKRTSNDAALPDRLWRYFPYLRWVPQHVLDNVDVVAEQAPGLLTSQEHFLVATHDIAQNVDDFTVSYDASKATDPTYLISGSAATESAIAAAITLARDRTHADAIVLPEAVATVGTIDAMRGSFSPLPDPTAANRLRWAIPGSGPLPGDLGGYGNAAVLLAAGTTASVIGVQPKRSRYDLDADAIHDLGLDTKITAPQTPGAVVRERIDPARTRSVIVESRSCRLGILICEDLTRAADVTGALVATGVTHLVVLVLSRELTLDSWPKHFGASFVRDTGAEVIVVNSSAAHRSANPTADAVGTSMLVTATPPTAQVTEALPESGGRTRRPQIPQYAPYGTGLELADVRPGDVLLFPRAWRVDERDMASDALHQLIAALDGTHLTHAALVVERRTVGGVDQPVVLDYLPSRKRYPLVDFAEKRRLLRSEHGAAMVLRCRLPAEELAGTLAQAANGERYPEEDAAAAAVTMRAAQAARRAGIAPEQVNGFATEIMSAVGDTAENTGQMCAATIAGLLDEAGALAPPTNEPWPKKLQTFGCSWLPARPGTAATLLDEDAAGATTELLTAAIAIPGVRAAVTIGCAIAEAVSTNSSLKTAGAIAGPEPDPGAFTRWVASEMSMAEVQWWKTHLAAYEAAESKPTRLWTVADLVASPSLAPAGHVSYWWLDLQRRA